MEPERGHRREDRSRQPGGEGEGARQYPGGGDPSQVRGGQGRKGGSHQRLVHRHPGQRGEQSSGLSGRDEEQDKQEGSCDRLWQEGQEQVHGVATGQAEVCVSRRDQQQRMPAEVQRLLQTEQAQASDHRRDDLRGERRGGRLLWRLWQSIALVERGVEVGGSYFYHHV